jgi:hypothetical protein
LKEVLETAYNVLQHNIKETTAMVATANTNTTSTMIAPFAHEKKRA